MRERTEREDAGAALARLATDYDRWGLAGEADALRVLAREAVVRELTQNALIAAARARQPIGSRRPH